MLEKFRFLSGAVEVASVRNCSCATVNRVTRTSGVRTSVSFQQAALTALSSMQLKDDSNSDVPLRILVAGGFAPSLLNFRGPLLRDLRQTGAEVWATASEHDNIIATELARWGIRYIPVALQRSGVSPLSDWRYYRGLQRLMREYQPQLVFSYTHKPVVYSALASTVVNPRPRVFAFITGLGFAFIPGSDPRRLIARHVLRFLYHRAVHRLAGVLFQNPDDQALFADMGLVPKEAHQLVVRGSGVDLQAFPDTLRSIDKPIFLLIARLLPEKGLREWIQAAAFVKRENPDARFVLVGPIDPSPSGIGMTEVEGWVRKGVIEYDGELEDVRPVLQNCTAYVLPSYREGTPRTVLEAMATGRAVITTDVPGCRETIFAPGPADAAGIKTGRNGMLVPARSVSSLAEAMMRFVRKPELAIKMGREGRRLAEEYYDVRKVNKQVMEFVGLA